MRDQIQKLGVYDKLQAEAYKNEATYPDRKDPEYKAKREAYNQRTAALEAEFKNDLYVEFGVVGHPKADQVFSLAWSHGHSAGYAEVANYFSEFVELIK